MEVAADVINVHRHIFENEKSEIGVQIQVKFTVFTYAQILLAKLRIYFFSPQLLVK